MHETQFVKLTNIDVEHLKITNTFNIPGRKLNNNYIIHITAYRIVYYMYKIKEIVKNITNNRKIVLEIGGGFGLSALILNRLINNCYIIVDIPSI